MSLHKTGQFTQLLLQLQDGIQVTGVEGGLGPVPQQPQHVVQPWPAGHRLQGVGGVTSLGVGRSLFSRQLLLMLHEGVVSLLYLVILVVEEALGLLRLACGLMLGLPVNALGVQP